jgi:hypothetical protein
MQPQQPKQTQQMLLYTSTAQDQIAPQPWVKPTFERFPLNEALTSQDYNPNANDATSYAS